MIDYNRMHDKNVLKNQYNTASNLNKHINLHEKYSTNKKGYRNWIAEQYDFFDGCKILELGCGTGDFWEGRLDSIGENSTMVLSDFAEGMVKIVHDKYSACDNIKTMQIDIESIPFDDCHFDFVIANSMLYHVPNLKKSIEEVFRVLKPGGIFYAATYGEKGMTQFFNTTLKGLDADMNIEGNVAFTLQNGEELLRNSFDKVRRLDYEDSLEIEDTNDLIDYMLSMTSMAALKNFDRNELYNYYEGKKNDKGVIYIPKEYGTFVSIK